MHPPFGPVCRQRSKSRSGRQTVKTTRKTTSKKVTVRGPQPLVDAWDKKKTVMQKYGLVLSIGWLGGPERLRPARTGRQALLWSDSC